MWLQPYNADFKKRLVSLLGYEFRTINIKLALNLLNPKLTTSIGNDKDEIDTKEKENPLKINRVTILIKPLKYYIGAIVLFRDIIRP